MRRAPSTARPQRSTRPSYLPDQQRDLPHLTGPPMPPRSHQACPAPAPDATTYLTATDAPFVTPRHHAPNRNVLHPT